MAGHKKWGEIRHKKDAQGKKSVLIFGGDGWLAQRFHRDLENYGFHSWLAMRSIDITDSCMVGKALDNLNPMFAINAAGKTGRPNIDWCECEAHKEETWYSNVIGPLVLAEECAARNITLVHLSSGCIFDGASPRPGGFTEDDIPNPVSFYAETKVEAEKVLKEFNVLTLRLRMPVDGSPSPRNLITKLAGYPKVIDVENSITIIDGLVSAAARLMHLGRIGVYNVVNPGSVKHRDILYWYREIVDPTHKYELILPEELLSLGLATAGRSNCILSTDKLISDHVYLPNAELMIRCCLEKYTQEWPNYNLGNIGS